MAAPRKSTMQTPDAPVKSDENRPSTKSPRPIVVKGATAEPVKYSMIYRREPESGYTVTCPALPGVTTYGKTKAEARAMARDAVKLYLEELIESAEAIPGPDFQIEELSVEFK